MFRHSSVADVEDSGNLEAALTSDKPLQDFRFTRGQAKRHQMIYRQIQQEFFEQEDRTSTVVHISNGEARGRSVEGQRSAYCRNRALHRLLLPASGYPLVDLRGKPILYADTPWPIAQQELVSTAGCPFNTPLLGDNRARLSDELQESAIPVHLLILERKSTASLAVFFRDRSFHMVGSLGGWSRFLDHDLAGNGRGYPDTVSSSS